MSDAEIGQLVEDVDAIQGVAADVYEVLKDVTGKLEVVTGKTPAVEALVRSVQLIDVLLSVTLRVRQRVADTAAGKRRNK